MNPAHVRSTTASGHFGEPWPIQLCDRRDYDRLSKEYEFRPSWNSSLEFDGCNRDYAAPGRDRAVRTATIS
jgi:hypothetical protein